MLYATVWRKALLTFMYKFEIFKDTANLYRFRLVASNGEIVATSESYTRKAKAKQTITSIAKALFTQMPLLVDLTKEKV